MKILFFNYEYPPLGGGAANATFYILKEYAKMSDTEIDVVTSSVDSEYHLEKMGEHVRIHRLPIGKNEKNLHFQSQKDLLVYTFKAYFFSRKLLKLKKYDITHSFFGVPCGFISLILKKTHKLPYIVSLRGSDVPGYSERFAWLYVLLKPLVRYIWRNAFAVVSNSDGLKDLAQKTDLQQKIPVIYNGVDTEEFAPVSDNSKQKNIILCVSRLTRRKGIRYLIEAFHDLKNKQDFELVIVGEGDEKGTLEMLVVELGDEKRVKFLGLVGHGQLPAIYQSAKVFVLPSLNEGMSNTILEALASGLPIVATSTGGTKELVRDGENGLIVEMKNAEDIKNKLEMILSDDLLREKMSQGSRRIAQSLNWGSVAKSYVALYTDAIAKKS